MIDDRKMYKPGEEVSLKGWLRTIDQGKDGDVGGHRRRGHARHVHASPTRSGNEIAKGSMRVSAVGGFDTKFTLPKTPNLGYANIRFETQGRIAASYTRTASRSRSSAVPSSRCGAGEPGAVPRRRRRRRHGQREVLRRRPAARRAGQLVRHREPDEYTPPNRDDYVFGAWEPWWGYRGWYDEDGATARTSRRRRGRSHGKTDATGAHVLHMDFLSREAGDADVGDRERERHRRQSPGVVASAALIVHPSSLYVGLKTKKPFVEKGTPFDIDVIGVDLDGKARARRKIEVKAARARLGVQARQVQARRKSIRRPARSSRRRMPVPCTFATEEGRHVPGHRDDRRRQGPPEPDQADVLGAGGDKPPAREVAQERVQLIPDKKEYPAGDTAELLVQAPFYPAEGVVTLAAQRHRQDRAHHARPGRRR